MMKNHVQDLVVVSFWSGMLLASACAPAAHRAEDPLPPRPKNRGPPRSEQPWSPIPRPSWSMPGA